eukprot:c11669_g1_i1.p1 GENE.c11669_g1_i1~~c11669_g1_i1.p1  ORF type:complete len:256 (+),score=62.29 c11669_g1_i1:39-806(+)
MSGEEQFEQDGGENEGGEPEEDDEGDDGEGDDGEDGGEEGLELLEGEGNLANQGTGELPLQQQPQPLQPAFQETFSPPLDDQAKINQIIELGFSDEQARRALQQTGFNLDAAAQLLFGEDTDMDMGDSQSSHILPQFSEPTKLTVLVRQDLGMSVGKIVSQCAHAVLAAYREGLVQNPSMIGEWQSEGEPVIVLTVGSLQQLNDLAVQARQHNIRVNAVQDAGRTQVEPGTVTVVALGPDRVSRIDAITRNLPLA